MSSRFLLPCCSTMGKMLEINNIQWKQKLSFMSEGVYFCPPENTRYGATPRRCGFPLKRCPYCPEILPTNVKELEEFNERMKLKMIQVIAQ